MQDLSLHVLDIAQNSVRAGARLVQIILNEDKDKDLLRLEVQDDGKGMTQEMLGKVTSPFFTTRSTRHVGLGIPLLKQNCEQSGGQFVIQSQKGMGVSILATMQYSHIDRLPIGDMNSTMITLVEANPRIDWVYMRSFGDRSFTLDTREIKEILQEVPIWYPEAIAWLKAYLIGQNKRLFEE